MIRKLYERSFAIQRQMLFSYLAGRLQCQSSSICSYTPTHTQRVQQVKFCTIECNKSLNVNTESNNNIEISPTAIELQKRLQCTNSEAVEVYEYLSANCDRINLEAVNRTVKWLHRIGATSSIIVKNAHILLIPLGKRGEIQFDLN